MNSKIILFWMITCSVFFGVFLARMFDKLGRGILDTLAIVSCGVIFLLILARTLKNFLKERSDRINKG
ncbi:MAG: hypothetical protein V1645_04430 [archaeon]